MQTFDKHKIQVPRTARYFSLGSASEELKELWIVLHGYGQLAEYFLRKFVPIEDSKRMIIAPEGISRFYLDPEYKRVGASWMTREDRLDEIKDQRIFLDAVMEELTPQLSDACNRTLFGFSQGTATAWRWLKHYNSFDNLVIWAGSVPLEFSEEMKSVLADMNVWVVYAEQDQFIPVEKAKERIEAIRSIKPDIRTWSFQGTHTIPSREIQRLASEISEVR